MQQLKEYGRKSPALRFVWGKVRWYTSVAGMRQLTSKILFEASNLGWRTVECPICGWSGRTFMSTGTVPRPNARCPRCLSLERHRLLHLYLQNEWAERLDRPALVLEIAPGPYSYRMFGRYRNVRYVTTDLSSPQATTRSDITALPFGNDTIDLIVCYHVLVIVPDDILAMQEMYRVLRRGGVLLSSENVQSIGTEQLASDLALSPEEHARHFGDPNAYRMYGSALTERLTQAGFTVQAVRYAAHLDASMVQRHRLMAGDEVFVCEK